jgi:hypothetical protein
LCSLARSRRESCATRIPSRCCYKSANYLDNLVAAPRPPVDREAALADLRGALRAGTCSVAALLEFAAEHATYAPRPLRVGDVQADAGEREAAATALAILKLAHATRAEAEGALAHGAACVAVADREVYESFAMTGWEGVEYPSGLPLTWVQ